MFLGNLTLHANVFSELYNFTLVFVKKTNQHNITIEIALLDIYTTSSLETTVCL